MPPTRTSIYLNPTDADRLRRIKTAYGLGTSAACRAGLALLESTLKGEDVSHMKGERAHEATDDPGDQTE